MPFVPSCFYHVCRIYLCCCNWFNSHCYVPSHYVTTTVHHSAVNRSLDSFWFGDIMNKAAVSVEHVAW